MRTLALLLVPALLLSAGCKRRGGPPEVVDELTGPVLRVTAWYHGANGQTVCDTVSAPIEQQINGVEGLLALESESRDDGGYAAILRFKAGTDAEAARVLVQNRVNLAAPMLPEEVRRHGPSVSKGLTPFPRVWVILHGDATATPDRLAEEADRVQKQVVALPGVVELRPLWSRGVTLRVWLNPERLAVRALTAADVVAALERHSVDPETIRNDPALDTSAMLKLVARTQPDGAALGDLVISEKNGRKVLLRDVGVVEAGPREDGVERFNDGRAAVVGVSVVGEDEFKAVVKAATESLGKLPKGLAGEVVPDVTNGEWSLVELRLPDADRAKVEKAAADATKRLRELPGVPTCVAFGERDWSVVRILVKVTGKDADRVRKALAPLAGVAVRVTDLAGGRTFPVRLALTDSTGGGDAKLREWADTVAKKLAADGVALDPEVFPGKPTPQLNVRIDRSKATELGVSVRDIADTLRASVGDARVDDFNRFGRTVEVRVSLDKPRAGADDLKKLEVKSDSGKRVPLGTIVEFTSSDVPTAVVRVGLLPALRITADVPPGMSVAAATARAVEVAEAERERLGLSDKYAVVNLVAPKPR